MTDTSQRLNLIEERLTIIVDGLGEIAAEHEADNPELAAKLYHIGAMCAAAGIELAKLQLIAAVLDIA